MWADERMMALSDLLSNAVRVSHHGGFEIITAIMPDGRFEIRVEDRSIGVDAGILGILNRSGKRSHFRSADESWAIIVRQLMDYTAAKWRCGCATTGQPSVCRPKIGRKAEDGAK